jgi:hypothetical protein
VHRSVHLTESPTAQVDWSDADSMVAYLVDYLRLTGELERERAAGA